MIYKISGTLSQKDKDSVVIANGGIHYQVNIPHTVYLKLKEADQPVELIIYHYFSLTKNRGIPILIGFIEELEKEFFEKFISVSGVGPKAALRAFDKPIPLIAKAIEGGDVDFLTNLAGIGKQRAKQIVAHLQGKVGRFALLKDETQKLPDEDLMHKEAAQEARQILKRLQYKSKEINEMVKKALSVNPEVQTAEALLNEIYKQKKQ